MSDSQKWLTLVMLAALGFIIYLLQPILMPFLVGILLAYLASPLVDRLTHWRIPRILSVCIVFFGITLLFILMVGGLVPGIKNQIVYLNTRMPEFIKWANFQAIPWVERNFQINFKHLDLSELTDSLGKSWQEAGTIAGTVLSHIALSGMSIIGSLASIALIPVVTFYMMVDWNRLLSGMEDLLPRQFQPRVHSVM
jgi:predicted PurR-regulated permease PerM